MLTAGSFQTRLVIASAALFSTVLILVFFARGLVNESTRENVDNLLNMGMLNSYLAKIKNKLQDTERLVYQQAVTPDAKLLYDFQTRITELERIELGVNRFLEKHIAEPVLHPDSIANLQHMQRLTKTITELTRKMKRHGDTYFIVSADLDKRVPGMHILTDKLLPRNNHFIEAAELAIAESEYNIDKPYQVEINNLFQNLRYVWSQQISWVRLFIANRAGIFGEAQHSMKLSLENRQLYIEQVKNYIDRLGQLKAKGAFEIQQSQSYDDIREITVSYEEDFKKAKSIFLSDNWRVDLQQLKNTMSPLFEETWENIRLDRKSVV